MRSFLAHPRQGPTISVVAFLVLIAPFAAAGQASGPPGAADEAGAAGPRLMRIEGTVLLPDGGPARGAVVVSSAGGQAAANEDGAFALELAIDPSASAVELSAVANGARGPLIARKRVDGLREGARNAGTLLLAEADGCVPEWIPTFGATPGIDDTGQDLAVFDDGSGGGPALYAGGGFTTAGGQAASRIARWDGQGWSPLASGMNDAVFALAVFDDGSGAGPALYAGGEFTTAGGQAASRIARWDGQSWSPLASGMNDVVYALAVFDDGSGAGPALYAGGIFTSAGGQGASGIAKWDGQAWSALGIGVGGPLPTVRALAVFDDGSGAGSALYAGGFFTEAGGQSANRIARWNGQAWSALGSGVSGSPAYPAVLDLTVHDDRSGAAPALYACGEFTTAGGQDANRIARWNGLFWSALGSGLDAAATSLAVFDDGSGAGPALYAGGAFNTAGGQSAGRIARWDGGTWSALGSGVGTPGPSQGLVLALEVFDDGSGAGPALHTAGSFLTAGGTDARRIAKWDGQEWSDLGMGLYDFVYALTVFDDGSGSGPALYAAGKPMFTGAPGAVIAKWDGHDWSALGEVDYYVLDLTVFDDGSGAGPALYAGGSFTTAGGVAAQRIAKWDGQAWSALGLGMDGPPGNSVNALAVFDDGSGAGPALYAGGYFTTAGGGSANGIARWDGQSWSALGSGLGGVINSQVLALAVFDDGSGAGPALYAGGEFTTAGGQAASRIARWDGQTWSALGSGMNAQVEALAVFDDGSGAGPALYAGGYFTTAGGQGASRIARWNGLAWSALGTGMGGPYPWVHALAVFDDGSGAGPALYAGGPFTVAGGQSANRIARWSGQAWSALGSGVSGPGSHPSVQDLTVHDDGSGTGPALYAGGLFNVSPAGDSYLARWSCPAIDTVPGCFGNPAQLLSLSSELSIGSTFDVSLSGSQITSGLGVLFFGLDGTDGEGCGLFAPGLGELLLAYAPPPQQVAFGSLSSGSVAFALPVPDQPSLVGVEIAFQGAAAAFDPGQPIELSNGLRVTIMQ